MPIERLSDNDFVKLSDLCDRAGIAPVLQALGERLAFESNRDGASPAWDEAFRAVMHALQRVAHLEGVL
ncbi:MAG TPA: hypothetical protein VMI75_15470 [Polyangiaceae bacterium]|nr:hypothetical protein [Polyangiaceae bacterium]